MIVTAVTCATCGDTIYSRARHDFAWCSCGQTGVDGGRDYLKAAYTGERPKLSQIDVDATDIDLYLDWHNRENKFGKIKKTPTVP